MPFLSSRRITTGIATLAAAAVLVGAGVNFAFAAPVVDRGTTHRGVLWCDVEANPAVGIDFAFDSTGDDLGGRLGLRLGS